MCFGRAHSIDGSMGKDGFDGLMMLVVRRFYARMGHENFLGISNLPEMRFKGTTQTLVG
jgi:hypothetical protein